MSNNFRDRRVTLPHDASLGDEPADVGAISAYPTATGEDIVAGLVSRSGDPRQAMGARFGTDGLCETCQLTPDQPAPAEGHPYYPVVNRVPGVHPTVDDPDRAPRNAADDGPAGEQLLQVDDPWINSGAAEAEFNAHAARHREGVWPRPTTLIDRNAVRNGYGPGVVRVDY